MQKETHSLNSGLYNVRKSCLSLSLSLFCVHCIRLQTGGVVTRKKIGVRWKACGGTRALSERHKGKYIAFSSQWCDFTLRLGFSEPSSQKVILLPVLSCVLFIQSLFIVFFSTTIYPLLHTLFHLHPPPPSATCLQVSY